MKNYIIGIAGVKGSGKDTVASMINYIFAVGIARANYSEWIIKQDSFNLNYNDRIIHFADVMKDVLSIMYSIPRNLFDDRKFKDDLYYNIKSGKFAALNTNSRSKHFIITIDMLKSTNLSTILNGNTECPVYIKLRTLMQYFATDVCRNNLADDIWIRSAMNRIVDKATSRNICIVPDIRFNNEANAIKCNNDSLYGGVIKIIRDSCEQDNHASETQNFDADFVIENNGNIIKLFYKVLQICQTIK